MLGITLRLMLVLCLVLGGIGNAMAAVAIQGTVAGSAEAVMAMSRIVPPSTRACDHPDGVPAVVAAPVEIPSQPASHLDDCDEGCCVQDACSCPCVQMAQAALRHQEVLPAPPGRALVFAALPLGDAAPIPLELMRPPIG